MPRPKTKKPARVRSPLGEIAECCLRVIDHLDCVRLGEFQDDVMIRDAVALRILLLGARAEELSAKTKKRFPSVDFQSFIDFRRGLLGDRAPKLPTDPAYYRRLNAFSLWNMASQAVPSLLKAIAPERAKALKARRTREDAADIRLVERRMADIKAGREKTYTLEEVWLKGSDHPALLLEPPSKPRRR